MWNFDCDMCKNDPELKKSLGCETPTQMPVWEDDEHQFFSCPRNFLTHEAVNWFDHYKYITEFPGSASKFGEQSNRFLLAMNYFNNRVKSLHSMVNTAGKKDKTAVALSTLEHNFKKVKDAS